MGFEWNCAGIKNALFYHEDVPYICIYVWTSFYFLPRFINFSLRVPAKLAFCCPVFAEINKSYQVAPWSDLQFLVRCTIFSLPYRSGFQSRWLSKRLFAPILPHYCAKRKVLTLKCAILFISLWSFCVNSAIKAFNKKTVCSITLYCFTWSGKALHQTAGAVQTVSPGPWGGHYDRDEQLNAL